MFYTKSCFELIVHSWTLDCESRRMRPEASNLSFKRLRLWWFWVSVNWVSVNWMSVNWVSVKCVSTECLWSERLWTRLASVQPIADRVSQHLEIISKNFQFSTRRTRILMGFIIYCLVLIVNPICRILVRWKRFRHELETLCHPICNWLYQSTSKQPPNGMGRLGLETKTFHR